jgi:hypothetical protein
MAITLSADQRNAIRDQIFVRLTGIDDVRLNAQAGDFQAARRLAGESADDHIALASEQPVRVELRENEEVNFFVVQTCRRVLAEVDSLS